MIGSRISVVVPCFNEEKTVKKNILHIHDFLNSRFSSFEIVAVNDGSSDRTYHELESLVKEGISLKIINISRNHGKGWAVKRGMLESDSLNELVMFLDADLGIPIEELEKFILEIKKGNDLVIASRFVPGLKVKKPVLWHRRFMEKVFRLLRMIIVSDWDVKDTQCGFKVFRREAAMKIFPKLTVNRFAFDAELIFVAKKMKMKIKELPISLQNPVESHVRIFRDPANMLLDLLMIRLNDWRGKYE